MVEYVLQMRKARVPGSGYITFGDATSAHEEEVTQLYRESGFEKKLQKVLGQN